MHVFLRKEKASLLVTGVPKTRELFTVRLAPRCEALKDTVNHLQKENRTFGKVEAKSVNNSQDICLQSRERSIKSCRLRVKGRGRLRELGAWEWPRLFRLH